MRGQRVRAAASAGVLSKVAVSACVAATLLTTVPTSASAAVAAAPRVIYPPRPLSDFPAYVGKTCVGWKHKHWPKRSGEYKLGGVGRVYTGGVFENRPTDPTRLPRGSYHEYDVAGPGYAPTRGHRGALRLVRERNGTIYYTSNHYQDFTPIQGGC